jgi:DnaK suppressor protein
VTKIESFEGGKTMQSIACRQYLPADDEPYMNPKQLAYFRQLLLRQRRELTAQARDSLHKIRAGASREADPIDQGVVAAERDFFCQAHLRHDRLLARVEEALARIEEGNYGYCEETGEAIGLKRLLAQPAATLSVEAQERMERLQRLARSRGVSPAH